MLARIATTSTLPDIAVEILGKALVIRFDLDRLITWVEETAQGYLDQIDIPASTYPFAGLATTGGLIERRSKEEFRREVQRWREAALADPASGVAQIAARVGTLSSFDAMKMPPGGRRRANEQLKVLRACCRR